MRNALGHRWKYVAFWGLALNAAWEFGQCLWLYDMWSWGFWRTTVWMWAAQALRLWRYSRIMPTVEVPDHTVGTKEPSPLETSCEDQEKA